MLGKDSRFSIIFDQVLLGFALIDKNTGQLVRFNQRFCDIVGLEKDVAEGCSFMEIAHPDDLQEKLQKMHKLMEGGLGEFTLEKRFTRDDGSMVFCNLTIFSAGDSGEEPNCHLAIIEDVTARKSAEEKAQKINDLLGQRVVDLTAAFEEKTKELEATEKLLKEELLKLKEAN